MLAGPDQAAWIVSPPTNAGNATALARAALAHARPGVPAYLIRARYERSRAAPAPKPFAMAEQALALDEDLPPIDLILDAADNPRLALEHPAGRYLLPGRGSGVRPWPGPASGGASSSG